MVLLACYSIWYCHTALSPFSRMRRLRSLDQNLRTALFQTESIQRGYLLTRDASFLSLYLPNCKLEYAPSTQDQRSCGRSRREMKGR